MGREGDRGRDADRGHAFIKEANGEQSKGADISHGETY